MWYYISVCLVISFERKAWVVMETKILTISSDTGIEERISSLSEAGEIIQKGGLVAFPTETVYGLGGDALNPESSRKIYEAKGRPSDNPLIVHIADIDDLNNIVSEVPDFAKKLADEFWPGPLTMVFNKSDKVPYQTTGGLNTVAVRMPSHKLARDFIKAAGGYVAAPSANLSGKPSPTSAKYVIQDMMGRIDMIIDYKSDEDMDIGLESTIVDTTGDKPMILRPGYITRKMVDDIVGETDIDVTIMDADSKVAPKAPGMKYRHYAPKGELVLVAGDADRAIEYINKQIAAYSKDGKRTGIIGIDEFIDRYNADSVKNAGSKEAPEQMAQRLYTFLREFDDENIEYMYAHVCSEIENSGLGQAVMNRLLKAAGHKIVRLD